MFVNKNSEDAHCACELRNNLFVNKNSEDEIVAAYYLEREEIV